MPRLLANPLFFKVLSCLLSLQLLIALPIQAQTKPEAQISTLTITTNAPDLKKMMDLSVRIMLHGSLYKLINETFGPLIENPTGEKIQIPQSKIIFLLSHVKESWSVIEDFLKKVPAEKAKEPDLKDVREHFRKIFAKVIEDDGLIKLMKTKGSVSQPLLIVDEKKTIAYDNMSFYANHPYNVKGKDGRVRQVKASDHKQIMIDIVNSAKKGDRLSFNFYDFDLPELADALIAAQKRGVKILGGVDKGVVESKPSANDIYKKLRAAGVPLEMVDSVGLNHQKLMALISKDGQSKTLMSSGNPTQSCSGAEGDLKEVPPELRPKESIPNPNNMIVIDGDIPAVIATAEIEKNVVYKMRGQKEFPVSGAYQLQGPKRPGYEHQDWMIMAFSPNGGLGDINRDIYTRVFRSASGPIYGAFFSFSSEELGLELTKKIVDEIQLRKKEGRPMTDLVKFVGDTRFAMRDFSILLRLSGYRLVEFDANNPNQLVNTGEGPDKDPEVFEPAKKGSTIKVYVEDPHDPLSKPIRDLLSPEEWADFRQNIRITADWFKETKFEYDGKKLSFETKLHDKMFVFIRDFISNPGSSINFSNAGESNQEQIAIVFSKFIAEHVEGVINFLFDQYSGANRSITSEVERRNKNATPEQKRIASDVLERKNREQKKQTPEIKNRGGQLTCPGVFAR